MRKSIHSCFQYILFLFGIIALLPACIPSFVDYQGTVAIMLFHKVEKALQPLLSFQINLTLKAFISST